MDDECANPLLLGWVKEWLEEARHRNSKGASTYKKAYDSLKACPTTFEHPSEAKQLQGFGPKICDRLTDKLKQYSHDNGLPMPEIPQRKKKSGAVSEGSTAPAKKVRKLRPYVPAYQTGAYALILALSSLGQNSQGISKADLIELAQKHCSSSFSAPSGPTKFHTAWSSMRTLVGKEYVCEKGRPTRYTLTDEGFEVAKRIEATIDPEQQTLINQPSAKSQSTQLGSSSSLDDDGFMEIQSSPVRPTTQVPAPEAEASQAANFVPFGEIISDKTLPPTFSPITVTPSAFTVQLVLDVREIRAKQDRDYMAIELAKKGVKPIMRSLALGDALWVAKCKDPNFLPSIGAEGDEIVLDYIVERKRLDDLVASIKDGRFLEQKFRLKKSGVKNVIYIIEEIAMSSESFDRYEEAVESAIASSQVVNGYFVKKTQKMDDTICYLTRMTLLLKELYESKPLKVIPTRVLTAQNYGPLLMHLAAKYPSQNFNITYPAFASLASKSETLTLRDVFLKMLMCTRGVTGEKALEIQKRWKTPQEFVKAFERYGATEEGKKRKREMVAGEMGGLVGRKKIAKILSGKIAEVWADV
jgi:crossover junction endonuclease MUS81